MHHPLIITFFRNLSMIAFVIEIQESKFANILYSGFDQSAC